MADITMPQLGETVTEGTITRWTKAVGDQVAEDEVLYEVSTDKVDSEVPSPSSGYVAEILVSEGETVAVGTILARISSDAPAGNGAAPAPPATPEPAAAETEPAEVEPEAEAPTSAGSTSAGSTSAGSASAASASAEAGSGVAGAAGAAPFPPGASLEMRARTVPTATVSPSDTRISATYPLEGDGTSESTLSVETS